jgi:hypothetical protein
VDVEFAAEYIISGFIALSGAIIALWRVEIANQKECREDLKETRELREKDNEEIKDLIGKVEHLQGEQEGFMAGAHIAVERVVQEVKILQQGEAGDKG